MAQAAATINIHLHLEGATFNLQPIRIYTFNFLGQFHDALSHRQAIFAFFVSALLNFLQLKSQGKHDKTPFQSHPRTTLLALASLLIYSLAYYLRISRNHLHRPGDHQSSPSSSTPNLVCTSLAASFGALLLASLLSILLPDRLFPLPFSLAVLFTLSLFPNNLIKRAWNWVKGFISSKFCGQPQRRRTAGLVGSMNIPARLPQNIPV